MKIGLILHGGKWGTAELLIQFHLEFGKFNVVSGKTSKSGEAEQLARVMSEYGVDAVVVCGGDGSVNQAVNGILTSKNPNTPLAIWPCGTANDFIKSVSVPNTLQLLKRSIEERCFRRIDVAQITHNHGEKHFFLNVTDVGLGGGVARDMQHSKRRLGSFLTYQLLILKHLISYRKKRITFFIDGKGYENRVMNFVVANTKYFGSGLGISPDSNPSDGQLEIVVIGDIGLLDYMRFIAKVRRCEKIDFHKIHYYRGREIGIETEVPMPIDMDGEFIGYSPLTIEIKDQISVVVSSEITS
jgi:diacylglycerol kinase (ATP)